jgi:hypothetical protein
MIETSNAKCQVMALKQVMAFEGIATLRREEHSSPTPRERGARVHHRSW